MTSNDTPASGARPPRRRTLGRGPGAAPPTPAPAEEGAGAEIPAGPSPVVTSERGAAERGGSEPPRGTPEDMPGAEPPARVFSRVESVTSERAADERGEPEPPRGAHAGETDAAPPLGATSPGEPGTTPEDGLAEPGEPGPAAMPPREASAEMDGPGVPPEGTVAGSEESGPRRPPPVEPVVASEYGTVVPGEAGPRARPATVERAGAEILPGGPSPGEPGASLTQETVARAAGPDTPAVGGAVSVSGEPESVEASGAGTGAIGVGRAGTAAPGGSGGGAEPAGGAPEAGEDGDGRFKVRLVNFEGPFDLLLQLISKHKLDVTEVALSKVTDEFMAYIRALGPDWDLDETTEFLVVAATLLDLKAARLLPAAEVEDEADLALLEARDLLFARLLQYRAYKQIAGIFSRRLDDEGRRYPRTVGLEPHHAELLPDVVISIGAEGFARLAVKAMQPRPKPQVYVDHIHAPLVSVQEQAGIVVTRLKELGEASFRALVEDTDDTLTVVARFLALLELYREKAVALDQEAALGELTVRWTGGDGDAAPTVTDEFDRPPEQPEEERKP